MAATRRLPRDNRHPLLPPQVSGFLWRRVVELCGMVFVAAGFLLAAALFTYEPGDPSWNVAAAIRGTESAAARNVLGLPGAYVSDALMQILGGGAYAFALLLVAMGIRTASQRRPGRWPGRILVLTLATLLATTALAGFPAFDGWPLHHTHLGGAAGQILLTESAKLMDAVVGFSSETMIAMGAAYAAGLLGVMTLGFALSDVRILWRWPIWLYRNLRPMAARGAAAAGAGLAVGGAYASEAVRRTTEGIRREPVLAGAEPAYPTMDAHPAAPATAPGTLLGGLRAARSRAPADAPSPERHERAAPVVAAPPRPVEPSRKASQAKEQAKQTSLFEPPAPEAGALPPLDLLQLPAPGVRPATLDEDALQKNAGMLEGVLGDFGVRGRIVKVSPGPVVTLYELEPAPGTKSSRVIGLADDIARSMSAVSARVAVVPGRNVIGIELPNIRREIVYMRELLQADAYERSGGKLPLVLGKDIGGQPVIADLARMPHLLVAGTTGSGKSVAINTMILSLLYRLPPDKCRFIMVDPKMLELSVYEGIPHLLAPVVTDPKKAITALKWTVREMEDRYRAMSKLGVRNIEGYNQRLREAKAKGEVLTRKVQTGFDPDTGKPVFEETPIDLNELPYIVVIVDEMADLMLVAGKDIEAAIQRLAQMARAAGIHLIMATQRPSVDVITGTIKANFPTRISFQVTSRIDSRTILGEQGAEQLLGQGDMLYMAGGGRITRVHGPFVRDDEVEAVVGFLKAQGEPLYVDAVLEDEDGAEDLDGEDGDGTGSGSGDQLYDQAVAIVIRERKASTSYIQRQLRIGYNSAARLVERMEAEGILSRPNHAGKREILVGE